MIKTNGEQLFAISVLGKVAPPVVTFPYQITHDGNASMLPSLGGITYNFGIGDKVFGRVGDHVEPGVSCKADEEDSNKAFNLLSCIGNKATVWSGKAEGTSGTVTGKHSVINHVLVQFSTKVLDKLKIGDEIQIRASGQGLCLSDYPGIKVMNISVDLLEKLAIVEKKGFIELPVAAKIPAYLAGSGIGTNTAQLGDVDIMATDQETKRRFELQNLRIGDLVAIEDISSHWGFLYRKDAISIGVVVHADSVVAGHGPGVSVIISANKSNLTPVVKVGSNVGDYLGLV